MSTHLDPATVEILCAVQAAAMRELLNGVDEPAKEALARAKVARALFDAAVSGERDPERLKAAAIKGAARLLRHPIDSSRRSSGSISGMKPNERIVTLTSTMSIIRFDVHEEGEGWTIYDRVTDGACVRCG